MTAATLMLFLVLSDALQWEFSHVEHINGTGARDYCEDRRRWKDAEFSGVPGDVRIICMDDLGVEL